MIGENLSPEGALWDKYFMKKLRKDTWDIKERPEYKSWTEAFNRYTAEYRETMTIPKGKLVQPFLEGLIASDTPYVRKKNRRLVA
jgi:hypothetical protein